MSFDLQRNLDSKRSFRKRLQAESWQGLHPTLAALLPAILDKAFQGEL